MLIVHCSVNQLPHLLNTYWAVALPQIPTAIAVFVFKQFFDGLPPELVRRRASTGKFLAHLHNGDYAAVPSGDRRGVDLHVHLVVEQPAVAAAGAQQSKLTDHPSRPGHRRATSASVRGHDGAAAASAHPLFLFFQRQIVETSPAPD